MKMETIVSLSLNSLTEQEREDHYIGSLNPLEADAPLRLVPTLNEQRDTIALVLLLVDLLPSVAEATMFDFYHACAAMRDIGIMLGSLKRHGVEPVNVIPELEEKLNILGNITDLPPRDTLIHYVRWNPEGRRLRTYTGTEDERQLIKSVQIAMHPLHKAILFLDELYDIPLDSPDFVPTCEQAIENFDGMVQGIVNAKRKVSPRYFAEELRFYYDPIMLNDREYLGPGAVEMPVFVFDHILWNCDLNDDTCTMFKKAYAPYNQTMVRELCEKYENSPSIVTRVIADMHTDTNFSELKLQSAKTLLKLFNLLKSFRAPHKKLADEAYVHAGKEDYREKGSGGYAPDILHYILKINLEAQDRLKESVQTYAQKGAQNILIQRAV